ncbi:hypothetical protein [Synechococcus phage MinM1]|nr:hypothetical protein [Synechococcus phage MinM1]
MEPMERAAAALIEHEGAWLAAMSAIAGSISELKATVATLEGQQRAMRGALSAALTAATPEVRAAVRARLSADAAQIGLEGSAAHEAALALLTDSGMKE